jgi:hypothetical protein
LQLSNKTMATVSRLHTRFRDSSTQATEDTTKNLNFIILDIDQTDLILNIPKTQVYVFTKDEVDECIDYITSGIEYVFLFISSSVGNIVIPAIHDYEPLKSIYIIYTDEQYQNYSNEKQNVRGVFNDFDTMLKQLEKDTMFLMSQYFSNDSSFRNINSESAEILWWRIFDKILQNVYHTNIAKDEFIAFFQESLPGYPTASKQFEELKSYTSDQAIRWYTGANSLYYILNKTLRTQNNFNNILLV